jgi:hypothetical protein
LCRVQTLYGPRVGRSVIKDLLRWAAAGTQSR